jgi:hypothetical protein
MLLEPETPSLFRLRPRDQRSRDNYKELPAENCDGHGFRPANLAAHGSDGVSKVGTPLGRLSIDEGFAVGHNVSDSISSGVRDSAR